jgi:hypothetical protein
MSSSEFFGTYRGYVHATNDPLRKNRIKLRIPQLFADVPTEWAWPIEQPVVDNALPKVGQGVWVLFEGGNPAFPLWIGTFSLQNTLVNQVFVKEPATSVFSKEHIEEYTRGKIRQIDLVQTLVTLSDEVVSLQSQVDSLSSGLTALEGRVSALET